jgi:HSP20 family protein
MTMMRRLPATSTDVFRQFDRLFDDWMRAFPARMSVDAPALRAPEELIRVDEYLDDGTLVIKAEIPGIDPDEDLTINVHEGILDLRAERKVAEDSEDQGYTRHEMRYGMFSRRLPLPEGVDASAVTAAYKDGILTVRVPVPEEPGKPEPTPIAVEKG